MLAPFGEDAFEVASVVRAAGGADDEFEFGFIDEAAVEGDFFDAGDLEVLLVFDGGDVVACFEETGGGTGVEPCDAAAEEADFESAVVEVGVVEVGDFEFAASGGFLLFDA